MGGDAMTTATEHAHRRFMESALSDDGGGYPDRTGFVAQDIRGWEGAALDYLEEGLTSVVVGNDGRELVLVPRSRRGPLGWIDRKRGRVRVELSWRHGDARSAARPATVDRHALARLVGGADER
jgi:hypothetical protein